MARLAGKVAIVTGAAAGVGLRTTVRTLFRGRMPSQSRSTTTRPAREPRSLIRWRSLCAGDIADPATSNRPWP